MTLLVDGVETENYTDVGYDTAQPVSEGHDRREIRQGWLVQQPEYRAYVRRGQAWAKLTRLLK